MDKNIYKIFEKIFEDFLESNWKISKKYLENFGQKYNFKIYMFQNLKKIEKKLKKNENIWKKGKKLKKVEKIFKKLKRIENK